MATAAKRINEAERTLTYRTLGLATLRSSCERFRPVYDAPAGRIKTTGHLEVSAKPNTSDTLLLSFAVTVTGHSKADEADIAFTATCTVGYEAKFDAPQTEDLPDPLVMALATPLFHAASERCRHLVWGMGFPIGGPTKMPPLEKKIDKTDAEASQSAQRKVKAAKKSLKPKKETA